MNPERKISMELKLNEPLTERKESLYSRESVAGVRDEKACLPNSSISNCHTFDEFWSRCCCRCCCSCCCSSISISHMAWLHMYTQVMKQLKPLFLSLSLLMFFLESNCLSVSLSLCDGGCTKFVEAFWGEGKRRWLLRSL